MSAWSHIDCSPVNPVFTAVPWKLPDMLITISKTLVSLQKISKLYFLRIELTKTLNFS